MTLGNLTLVLLPSSDIRLSFIGDDGKIERLFTLTSKSQCAAVVVDEIPTDSSGRSFLVRTPDSRTFYFWCSEKSKLLGVELLAKMKDLLKRKASIAELSGISRSRLDCFASQLRAFLVGSTVGRSLENSVCASTSANSTATCNFAFENSVTKGDTTLYQSILSLRLSSFKEVPPRILSSHRIAAWEKIKRHGDSHQSAFDNLANKSTNILDLSSTSDYDKASEVTKFFPFSSCFLGSLGNRAVPSNLGSGGDVAPVVSSLFSPDYCWCPPGISTFSSLAALPQVSNSSVESTHLLPILCHLACCNLCNCLILGYLVSAGPAMSTSIPQLHPKLVKPLISESDAVVKGARETLRLLVCGSSQGNQKVMMDPFPAILTNSNGKQNNILVAASCGLYNDTRDIDVITNSIAAMGLASLSGVSMGEGDSKVCGYYGMSESEVRIPSDSSSTFLDDKGDPPLDSTQ
ncbi:hypothetical protein Lalb_Chr17g0346601 [Lupinus albus]|uniref:Uncharacterized protein n=1 Tax=Lupinus albus TaxID=3870 RepID=A0A6A4P8M4_LUPAL|nr:hypothetical protein Lalb_Chr17g0346601 [Lupinus albus]